MRRITLRSEKVLRGIGIAATSTVIDKKIFQNGLSRFSKWGIPALVDDRVYAKYNMFAGSDPLRAHALLSLLRQPMIGTVWCARGGYGSTRILSLLDALHAPKAQLSDPKLILGYSDVTALHFYFYQKCKTPSVHAPMPATPHWLHMKPKTEKILQKILSGNLETGKKSYTADWNTKHFAGNKTAEGMLLGGNLTLLVNLIGTPWQPNLNGSILFLEDCGEAPYRIDRMLVHLENAGMLNGVQAVALGDFEADVKYRNTSERKLWKNIFHRFADLGIPTIHKIPVGHGKYNEPLPLGVPAAIRNGKLFLLGQPVQNTHSAFHKR